MWGQLLDVKNTPWYHSAVNSSIFMYEFYCVASGNISEEQAQEKLAEIKERITASGAVVEDMVDLGRQKLAYPIAHQDYGFVYTLYIQIDGDKVVDLRKELERHLGLLRVFARAFNPTEQKKAASERTTSIKPKRRGKEESKKREVKRAPVATIKPAAEEKTEQVPAAPKKEVTPEMPTLKEQVEAEKEAVAADTKDDADKSVPVIDEKKADLEAIDAKLDELLDTDMIPEIK